MIIVASTCFYEKFSVITVFGRCDNSREDSGDEFAGRGDIEGAKAILGDFWIGQIVLLIIGFYFGAV